MERSVSRPVDANSALARGRERYSAYRIQGEFVMRGQGKAGTQFDEPSRRNSRRQLEREITGDTTDAMGLLKIWHKDALHPGKQAIRQTPNLRMAISRPIPIATPDGVTSINFRMDSLSKTLKRRSPSENWHSAGHARYIEREEAVADLGLELTPARASDYIERDSAVADLEHNTKALFSNISLDPAERDRFWRLVEANEPEGGENQLTIEMSKAGTFARGVAKDPDCPGELRNLIEQASEDDTIVFTGGDHVALRVVFKRYGWSAPPKGQRRSGKRKGVSLRKTPTPTPGITFKDARAGRTQIQANGELPAELSLSGKAMIAKRLHDWFDDRGLRVTVVVHAPDHKNNERNWHFHLAAYDRPCRRFSNTPEWLPKLEADATATEKKAHERLEDIIGDAKLDEFEGEWDFAVPCTYKTKSRNTRLTFPFEQNKDRFCNSDDFPEYLRKVVVDFCNDELEREGLKRRYDHRTYELMGINKEPDEHLDKAAAQLEKFGIPTSKGIANEERQWAFITAELDRQHAEGLKRIDKVFQRLSRPTLSADATSAASARHSAEQWRAMVISAQDSLRAERELKQLIERAKSRAAVTVESCQKHIDAIDSGTASQGEERNRSLYEERRLVAERHLAEVDIEFEEQLKEIERLKHQRFESMKLASQHYERVQRVPPTTRKAATERPAIGANLGRLLSEKPQVTTHKKLAEGSADLVRTNALERLAGFARRFPQRAKVMRGHDGRQCLVLDRPPPDLLRLAEVYGSDNELLAALGLGRPTTSPSNHPHMADAREQAVRQSNEASDHAPAVDLPARLLFQFQSAKTDTERRATAALIRANPEALQMMNKAADLHWKAEQQRYLELQQSASQAQGGPEY